MVETGKRIMQKDIENAVDVGFEPTGNVVEGLNYYKLSDGATVGIQVYLKGVKRLEKTDENGMPIYLISTEVEKTIKNIPKELQRETKVGAWERV